MNIPFHILEQSTKGFSNEQKLGSGGYGEVYKGLDQNGTEIAVKVLHQILGHDDNPFKNECTILMELQHPNIVQLGGNLHKYLSEKSSGCEWRTHYNIIKGISDGLNFIHGLNKPVFHLDLKPANILLDKNMVAKIADFGLSRLFPGTHTHITDTVIGTLKYMPPEFITKHHISQKNDVFSLGVIIIEIMTGLTGYTKFGEMDVTQFIELVIVNWRNRIMATSAYPTEELDQVETCLKIAIQCVNSERNNRPTVAEIVHILNETEIMIPQDWRNGAPSLMGQVCTQGLITKIGPWGGHGGVRHDLEVLPQRLISVVVRSGRVIDSLAFTYCDRDGQQWTAGPWGEGEPQGGSFHTILLGPSEFLKEVSGTIGPSHDYPDVVTSILFVTNADSYGPFGEGGGTPFHSPVQGRGSIVGFFANIRTHVVSVGVYFNPERETMKEEDDGETRSAIGKLEGDIKEQNKGCIARIGPWGGYTGWHRDIDVVPRCLKSITIRSGEVVISLAFSYSDDSGKQHHAGIWGSYGPRLGGTFDTIQLGSSEFLTGISGTVGLCTKYHCNVVTSLKFITNARSYGPFGGGKGIPFHSPVLNNASIVGFFAHATGYVDAIGVYLNPEREAIKEDQALVTKIGPWGGHSWGAHDVEVLPRRLISVVVHSGKVINSLEFTYSDCDGQQQTAGPWGEGALHDGSFHTILLAPSEVLKEVSGAIDDVVTSLLFVTSAGIHGPFGEGGGIPFRSPLQSNGSIVGFFAHIDKHVNGIGVYVG